MHPFNFYFDKVFVISIERNRNRLDFFRNQNSELEFEVFEGIDGKTLYPELQNVWEFPMNFFDAHCLTYSRCAHWNKGQLGCAMSNLLVQKLIIEMNLSSVLILEDDALINYNLLNHFEKAVNELPDNWELFYLGFNPPSRWSENVFTRQLLRLKHYIKPVFTDGMSSGDLSKRYFSEYYSKNLNKPGIYGGTHAYALSNTGARKVVELDTPLKYGFDTTLMYANYHKVINSFSLKVPLIEPNHLFETSLIN